MHCQCQTDEFLDKVAKWFPFLEAIFTINRHSSSALAQ